MGCATARADVQIVGVDGATRTVDLSRLKPDVPDATYRTIATFGGTPETVTVTDGYSLSEILGSLPHADSAFGAAEIVAPAGPPVILDNTQATSLYAYTTGGPPVVYGGGTQFLVPSAPTGTINAGETFTSGTITIELHRGTPLEVGISANPAKAIIGKPVKFKPSIFPATALTYQWSFGDGATASQATPSHTYTALGTYNFYLQVTGSEDSVGASSVMQIVVGNPPPKPIVGAGGGGTGAGSTGAAGSGTGSGSGGAGGSARSTGAAASKAASTTTPNGTTRRSRAHRTKKPKVARPTGPLVSGIAISYITPAASQAAAAAGAARAARAAHLRAKTEGLDEGMWIWFAVLLALFVGAFFEWTGPRRARAAIIELPWA
jgi:hypothetical protein